MSTVLPKLCGTSQLTNPAATHTGSTMVSLRSFQTTARTSGFVDEIECDEGTVLWLMRRMPDATANMCQRMCIDSQTNSATVYWTASPGRVNSRIFRSPSELKAWLAPKPDR